MKEATIDKVKRAALRLAEEHGRIMRDVTSARSPSGYRDLVMALDPAEYRGVQFSVHVKPTVVRFIVGDYGMLGMEAAVLTATFEHVVDAWTEDQVLASMRECVEQARRA